MTARQFRRREKKNSGPPGNPGVHRAIPIEIDAGILVPLSCCPHCSGEIGDVAERVQFIEECPVVKPIRTKLTTYTGVCVHCGDIESRHPLQISTATGAAGYSLGAASAGVGRLTGTSVRAVEEESL